MENKKNIQAQLEFVRRCKETKLCHLMEEREEKVYIAEFQINPINGEIHQFMYYPRSSNDGERFLYRIIDNKNQNITWEDITSKEFFSLVQFAMDLEISSIIDQIFG